MLVALCIAIRKLLKTAELWEHEAVAQHCVLSHSIAWSGAWRGVTSILKGR